MIKAIAHRAIQYITQNKISWRGWDESVYLTFDDGPHAEGTPAILDVLKKHNVKATFFVIGENARQHPDIVARIAQEGHTLANHSYSHPKFDGKLDHFLVDCDRWREAIQPSNGKEKLLRVPYGSTHPALLLRLLFSPYKVIYWNKDTKDYVFKNTDPMSAYVEINKGDIVLLHDFPKITPELVDKLLTNNPDKKFAAM